MEGMRFQTQRASSDQRMASPGQHIYDFLVPEYVELSEQLHHQMMARAIFSSLDLLVEVLAGQVSGRRPLASVPYGRRREVDADTMVSKDSQACWCKVQDCSQDRVFCSIRCQAGRHESRARAPRFTSERRLAAS